MATRVAPSSALLGTGLAEKPEAMHDTSFDDTLLVPRLPPLDPPTVRDLPQTFAQVRGRHWPWIVLIIAVLAYGAAQPIDFGASQEAVQRAQQADQLLPTLGR
jgi:hypothetical protein